MKIECTSQIQCHPAHLWSWIADPEKQKHWMKGLLAHIRTSDGPVGPGATFCLKIKEGRRIETYEGRIIHHDPYRHLALSLKSWSTQNLTIRMDYWLSDLGRKTRLDYCATVELVQPGPVVRLMMPLFRWYMKGQMHRFMKQLKSLAEEGVTVPEVQPQVGLVAQVA